MKTLLNCIAWLLVAANLPFNSTAKASVLIDFSDPTAFDSQFPISSRSAKGNASAVSLTTGSPSKVHLHAEESAGGASRMTIYSTANSEFNFLDSQKTFTFTNIALTFASSGSSYLSEFGVFSTNANDILGGPASNPGDGVYFQHERVNGKLHLYQIVNNARTELASWAAPNKPYAFLSLTLGREGWLVSGLDGNGNTISNATATSVGAPIGNFATAPTLENWGSHFYLGLQVDNSSALTGRFADLTIQTITVVPEPNSAMLTLAVVFIGTAVLRIKGSLFQ